MFILSTDGRDADVDGQFKRYRDYLDTSKPLFPAMAFALATSDWYYGCHNHRGPHDARLEGAVVSEKDSRECEGKRHVSLTIRLLGAYNDGRIELFYPEVYSYKFDVWDATFGHYDWRYDELRLSDRKFLLHEIEWCGASNTGRWLIEASDVELRWQPFA